MVNKYSKPLKVSTPEGKQIIITVSQIGGGMVKITLPEDAILSNDKRIAKLIQKPIHVSKYKDAILKLEKYFESLFLKEMSNDNLHTSDRAKTESGGNTSNDSPGNKDEGPRERSGKSIHSGSRRSDSSESGQRGSGKDKLAEDHS